MTTAKLKHLWFGLAMSTLAILATADSVSAGTQGKVTFSYVAPKNPAHISIYNRLQERKVLEKFVTFLQIFKLPRTLTFRFTGCAGEVDAWFLPSSRTVTVCYEYIAEVEAFAPKETTPEGVTREDAINGPVVEVLLHEAGHALFAELKVPLFGREEDAADFFAAYLMLQLTDAQSRSLLGGIAHMYRSDAGREPIDRRALSSAHGLPAQRLFNLACLAYGAKPQAFAIVAELKLLPPERLATCKREYSDVEHAMLTLFEPHLDLVALQALRARRNETVARP